METTYYLKQIQDAFPELEWSHYRRIQDGVDHVVIMLDQAIIFRFVDTVENANLVRERAVLSVIKNRLNIPIPDYTYLPKTQNFAGYKAIPGTRLTPGYFRRLSNSRYSAVAKRLGEFLSILHDVPVSEMKDLGVDVDGAKFIDYRLWAEDRFNQCADELEPDAHRLCERWLNDLKSKQPPLILAFTHNDFWHKHIYHDPQTGHLTGIIDWGDILITDPAWDFYGLWAYGEPLVDLVLSYYVHTDPQLKRRSWDYYRAKVISCLCFPREYVRKYARQLLDGLTQNISDDFR